MKKLIIIAAAFILFAGVAFGQEKFTVPDISPAQKHNRTNSQFWIMHAAGINFAKAQDISPYDYGKHIGNLFAPSWNKEAGFEGFVNGVIYNWETFKSDEDGPILLKVKEDGSVSILVPIEAYRKYFPGENAYATFEETMECWQGIVEQIADYIGSVATMKITEESVVTVISKK